jgi:hypothetical protein
MQLASFLADARRLLEHSKSLVVCPGCEAERRRFFLSPKELSKMGLLETILRPRIARQLQKLSLIIAERSLEGVRHRLNPMAYSMTPAEARGYVRARAAAVVTHEVDHAMSVEGRLPAWGRGELLRQATSHVVLQLSRELVTLAPSQVRQQRRVA